MFLQQQRKRQWVHLLRWHVMHRRIGDKRWRSRPTRADVVVQHIQRRWLLLVLLLVLVAVDRAVRWAERTAEVFLDRHITLRGGNVYDRSRFNGGGGRCPHATFKHNLTCRGRKKLNVKINARTAPLPLPSCTVGVHVTNALLYRWWRCLRNDARAHV